VIMYHSRRNRGISFEPLQRISFQPASTPIRTPMSYLEHALAPAGAAFRVVLFAAPIPTQQKLSTVCMKEGEGYARSYFKKGGPNSL